MRLLRRHTILSMRFAACILLFASFVFFTSCTPSDSIPIDTKVATIGLRVPDMDIATLKDAGLSTKKLYDYDQELLILDFWATWCGPCLTSFPKLSELQQQYKDQIKILAITDENPERIRDFLAARPQAFSVVIDSTKQLQQYFKHRVIPHYVILDAQKVVKAVVHSDFITKENIDKLLAGAPVEFKEKKERLDFNYEQAFGRSGQEVVYQSSLLPYNPDAGSVSNIGKNGNRLFAYNLTYPSLLKMAYDMPYTRVVEHFTNPSQYEFTKANQYCYEMIFPEHLREQRLQLMQAEISAISGIQAELETKMTDVWLLRKSSNSKIELAVSTSAPDPNAITRYGQGINMQGQPMSDLVNYYENVLELPVIDETGYRAVYDISIKWYIEDPKKGLEALDAYGLELVKAKRDITFLVLRD